MYPRKVRFFMREMSEKSSMWGVSGAHKRSDFGVSVTPRKRSDVPPKKSDLGCERRLRKV